MTGDTKRLRAAIYLRQSKARDDSISIELQREACLAHASREGHEVVGEWVDEGVSAYRPWERRPRFPDLMAAARAGDIDAVIVYRWSRLSRTRKDQYALIFMLEDAGVTVDSANEAFDVSTAAGRFGRGMMMEMAAFESDLKSEQFKEAQQRRVSVGLPTHGHPRFGYATVKDAAGKSVRFEPDPVTGPLLREMYLKYTSGSNYRNIAVWLDHKAVLTLNGRRWTNQSVKTTLDSGFGAGYLAIGTKRGQKLRMLRGAQQAVISEEEWLAYRRAAETRARKAPRGRPTRHYLTTLCRCGLCGGRMSSQIAKAHGYVYPRFRCHTHSRFLEDCPGLSIARDWLELKLAHWLSEHDSRVAAALGGDPEGPLRDAKSARDGLRDVLASIDTRLARLASGWASGLLDDTGYEIARHEAEAERETALDRVAGADEAVRRLETGLAGGWDMLFETENGSWNHGEITDRLSRVIDRVEVHKDRAVLYPHHGDPVTWPKVRRKSLR